MARARNIKPGFFRNENLVELPYETRLLFIGLWTICDREGRLEDRPKRIRMELFPADDLNVDACLAQLHDAGFILRYTVGDARYIQVLAFSRHQNPHQKEQASIIPAPDASPIDEGNTSGLSSASTEQALNKPDASTEVAGLDSLNTDSLFSETPTTDPPNPPNARFRASVDESHPFALLESLCNVLGQDTSVLGKSEKGKQLAVAKRLVEAGITPRDVEMMTLWLQSQSWVTGGIDLFFLERQLGKWQLAGKPKSAPNGSLTVHQGGRGSVGPDGRSDQERGWRLDPGPKGWSADELAHMAMDEERKEQGGM